MSGRSPSKPGSTPRRGRTDEVGTQPADDEHDDVTDPVGLKPGDRTGDKWTEAEQLDPADPRLADAIRRLQEAQSGAWDEDSLADLKPGAEPVAQEEITGTLSRYLENALRSSLAELEAGDDAGPDDVGTEPDPQPSLPGRVLANLPRTPSRPAAPSKPAPRSGARLTRADPPRASLPPQPVPEPSLPVPEPSLPVPDLPDLPDLEPTLADDEPLEPSMPEMPDLPDLPDLPAFEPDPEPSPVDPFADTGVPAPDPLGSWDEEPMSTSFDDDLGPVDEFTLSIHPELVQKAIAEAEAERGARDADVELQSIHDDPPRSAARGRSDALRPPVTSRTTRAKRDETPTSSRLSSSSEVSRLRALLEEPTPADGTLPTLQDGEERTVAIPEDEPERTVAASRRSGRPEPLEPSQSGPGPESVGERTMDILAAIADMAPGHDETIGDNLERLDELMTMADAPPEGEETIGASLERLDELMSIADAPPAHEETIGASLERIDQVKRALERKKAERASRGPAAPRSASRDRVQRSAPPRPSRSRSQRPPSADDSLGGSLEPVDEVPQVVMPGEVADPRPGERLTPRPPPRRPARPRAVRPSDELTQALPDKYQPVHASSMSDEKTQALPDAYLPFEDDYARSPDRGQRRRTPPPVAERAPRPAPPPDSTSDFMRRETYQPARGASAPPARTRGKTPPPAPPKVAPPQDFLDEDDDPYKEPILAWAATLFGFILFGGFTVLVLIAILMLF